MCFQYSLAVKPSKLLLIGSRLFDKFFFLIPKPSVLTYLQPCALAPRIFEIPYAHALDLDQGLGVLSYAS
jgi:hypothetical protein